MCSIVFNRVRVPTLEPTGKSQVVSLTKCWRVARCSSWDNIWIFGVLVFLGWPDLLSCLVANDLDDMDCILIHKKIRSCHIMPSDGDDLSQVRSVLDLVWLYLQSNEDFSPPTAIDSSSTRFGPVLCNVQQELVRSCQVMFFGSCSKLMGWDPSKLRFSMNQID